MVVDDRSQVEGDIILRHADLARYLDDLDLDINLNKALAERVDLNQARVDSAIEAAKLCDKTDISLRNWLVGIGTDETAGDGAHETDAAPERVDCDDVSIRWQKGCSATVLIDPYQPCVSACVSLPSSTCA